MNQSVSEDIEPVNLLIYQSRKAIIYKLVYLNGKNAAEGEEDMSMLTVTL